MSGGSYNYFYSKLEDMADSIRHVGNCYAASPALRKAFAEHLRLCARACKAIEWNDSGDGDDIETDLIRKCVAPNSALKQATEDAVAALAALSAEIENAKAMGRCSDPAKAVSQ